MHCKIDTKTLVQIAEDAARRVYSEGQRIDNERVRAIAYSELKRILEEKDKEEYIPHTRAGEPWTECEDRMLKEELANFFTKTAKDHRRSYGAIVSRIKQIYDKEY
jgi:hypothetical protein